MSKSVFSKFIFAITFRYCGRAKLLLSRAGTFRVICGLAYVIKFLGNARLGRSLALPI